MHGYTGTCLRVRLGDSAVIEEKIPEEALRKFIGGVGLGAYYLYNETDGTTEPLGPDNRLVFSTGPFALSGIPSTGRHSVAARSPLTGIWGEADCGGYWGLALKSNGFDAVVVQGKSAKPVYVYIEGGKASLLSADDLWGKDTFETDAALKQKHGEDIVVQCIGQAGENQVPLSAIVCDGRDARAAARCGLGAVMGSKYLKAIVVKRGSWKPSIAHEEKLRVEIRETAAFQVKNRNGMYEHGTAEGLIGNEVSGDLPIKNWSMGSWDGKSVKITGEVLTEKYLTDRFHCGNCVVGCGRTIKFTDKDGNEIHGGGPEYETIGCLGSNLLVEDMETICRANDMCNRWGLDTISTGGVIGFAMECQEKGLIDSSLTEGLSLEWGNGDAVLSLIEAIAFRKGLGRILGRGVKKAAENFGPLAKEFAIESKGLEFPAHEPRVFNSTALSYATSNRGACHLAGGNTRFYEKWLTMPEVGIMEPQNPFAIEGKGEMVANLQNVAGLYDCLKICKFMAVFGVTVTKLLEWLNLITGWNMSMEEFLRAGERVYNVRRMFNVRCGVSRKDDSLPPRILCSTRKKGGAANHLPPLNLMLPQYYEARGWDEFGIPTEQTLERLGLSTGGQ
jgi:aldehyde:ferredoxin oxidoreductase